MYGRFKNSDNMKQFWVNNVTPYLMDDKGNYSSARLAFFVAIFVAAGMSVAAIHLSYKETLDWNYVFLTLSVWAIATLQKNWSKKMEALK